MDSIEQLFGGCYLGRRVLVTGHTGFKGSWLVAWLRRLGAEVFGYSLSASTEPAHSAILQTSLQQAIGDIRDRDLLENVIREFKPEMVFHLAAQPIVRESYRKPIETFEVNVIGTLNVYEACRRSDSVRSIVSITTDKVYQNREWDWGYREIDPFGGFDPYSASKACDEIASASYRDSFWPVEQYGKSHHTLLCTARAGNVVGGGDWADDRLVPDLMRAAANNQRAQIRNPDSTRPWQHVLEPLSAYLMLGWRLFEGRTEFAQGWNIGPTEEGVIPVRDVVARMAQVWPAIQVEFKFDPSAPHEAKLLKLDCSKARAILGWKPVWNSIRTAQLTAGWYRDYYQKGQVNTSRDLDEYIRDAASSGLAGFAP